MKKIKHLSDKQNDWLKRYEGVTGFEPMHLDELEAKTMSFDEAAKSNIDWYEMHMHDAYRDITEDVPYEAEQSVQSDKCPALTSGGHEWHIKNNSETCLHCGTCR